MENLPALHDPPEPPKILVVDDDPVVRELMAEAIRLAGYRVFECGDGVEALEKNSADVYDLIVTDMRLPGLDGLSLIRELKEAKSETEVIVITGYGTIENAVECMKAGATDYLIKPFTVDQIQLAVRKAVEHRDLRRKAREREFFRELSYMDALTGIRNRRYFDEALEAEIQRASREGATFVLLMIDIDNFKVYNDVNGHQKGDEALKKIAALFTAACRSYDTVSRYGGEEFAIIFPGVDRSNAFELASRIQWAMRRTEFDGAEFIPSGALTVSIGIACFPEDARTGEDLLHRADTALYDAKNGGKNQTRIYGTS
jgi:diguanylate cyclase (GGDEF)-like protein